MFRNLLEKPGVLIVLILVIVVVLGWKRLPDMARSLGRSSRILKSEIDEMKTESKSKASQETVPGEATARTENRSDASEQTPSVRADGATRADDASER